jgi:hypothetical protein
VEIFEVLARIGPCGGRLFPWSLYHFIGDGVPDTAIVTAIAVGAPVIQAANYPCPVASKDRRPGFCHPPNSFEQRLLCKAQNVYLRGRHGNLMSKMLL